MKQVAHCFRRVHLREVLHLLRETPLDALGFTLSCDLGEQALVVEAVNQ